MNKTQIQYALSRIDGLLKEKETSVEKAHTKEAKVLSATERADLVRSGTVKMKADATEIHSYTDVVAVFDFSKHSWTAEVDAKAVSAIMKPLRKEAQKLKDEIMLGDASAAQTSLAKFSEKVRVDG